MEMTGKKNMAKASALLITLTSAVFLAACGAGPTDPKDGSITAASTTSTSETTTVAATTTGTTTSPAGTTSGTGTTSTPAPSPTPSPTPTPSPSAGSLGKTAWSNNCASCHGGQTSKGQNAGNTMTAIKNNIGGMGFLSGSISANDANNIAAYAANPGAY
jgi:hypothetical protein